MKTLETLTFRTPPPDCKDWVAKEGAEFDGASIPKALWSTVGGPFEGKYRDAAAIHDVACNTMDKNVRWQDPHLAFYHAMIARGVDEKQAKLMYSAVYLSRRCRWDAASGQEITATENVSTETVAALERIVTRETRLEDIRSEAMLATLQNEIREDRQAAKALKNRVLKEGINRKAPNR